MAPRATGLDDIALVRFRNHASTRLEGARQFNLLLGENGAGKTNVLEALSLLAPGRGLRRAALAEMAAQDGDGGFAVNARLLGEGEADETLLSTGMRPDRPGRRIVRINGADASALSLGEWLSIGWLTPAMDRLFMDSAGERRRFMDRMALALDPAHARHASRYERALAERNRLLSTREEPDPAWLDAVEAPLAEDATRLSAGRARLVDALRAELAQLHEQPFARPDLAYEPGGPMDRSGLERALRDSRPRDRAAQRTLVGPHRDELSVILAAKGMPARTCSTGEQKAMLIAIVLAHAERAAQGRPALLLLDEVAAHLDAARRTALFDRLRGGGAQVWMTGTDIAPFDAIAQEAAVWQVTDGRAERLR